MDPELGGRAVVEMLDKRKARLPPSARAARVAMGSFVDIYGPRFGVSLCLGLTAWMVPGFSVDGFWWALVGAMAVSVVSWVLNGVFHTARR